MRRKMLMLAALALVVAMGAPAVADAGVDVDHDYAYGYFYGTFDPVTNVFMTAGAPAEDFCPEGFDGSPATTTSRTSVDDDGSVHVRARAGGVEIHLYEVTGYADAPPWISDVCSGLVDAVAFASGVGVLEIHDTYLFAGGPPLRLFNSVHGHAFGPDGAKYRVHASAEIPFQDGVPVGIPPDWVRFHLRPLGG